MANTYTQIHIHFVFSVKNRASLITKSFKSRLYSYISAIVQKNDHKVLAISGTADHVHLLIGMRPNQSPSEIMKVVKGFSSKWINENSFTLGKFAWQDGFGAFSYSKDQLPKVIKYILEQEEHHKIHTFIDEYKKLLEDFQVVYDDRFIFKEIE